MVTHRECRRSFSAVSVAFAGAIVFELSVLLMDEPLSALDLKLREAMRLEIKRYHSRLDCAIIFATHDQGEALSMSDRIAVMDQGQISQIGFRQLQGNRRFADLLMTACFAKDKRNPYECIGGFIERAVFSDGGRGS
jgi:ABC-type sulfate/molybdate transport systems ATPase subunit